MTTLQQKVKDIDFICELYDNKWQTCGDEDLRKYYAKQVARWQKKILSTCGFMTK
jgi:hypothetical protein